ncbi:peptidylprolyl isomerase [Fulvivirga sediminis]|uniref:Peptidyl-prolyl cis-trans isomerase n=1 Tax=Fulvivirga sediminis TaxID=2803949 RepID=A0A937K1K5_9BACT|nr:peptidylprolyl isomerase [Fulvivirga sediminis]MBL3656772.1 peptidylprolyl isomerase [Fulvivirga sediminis]
MTNRILILALLLLAMGSCASEKDYLITIHTDYGDMHAILFDDTPEHKENFVKLAQDGFYDSLLFHRVIKDFMIQTGDPDSKNAKKNAPLGSGGPGYNIPAEIKQNHFHAKGALSAARQDDRVNPKKESSGSQFYIVQGKTWTKEELTTDMEKLGTTAQQLMARSDQDSVKQMLFNIYQNEGPEAYGKKLMEMKDYMEQVMSVDLSKTISPERLKAYTTIGGAPHLDDEYTVFGKVIDGLDIIDKIAEQPTDRRDRPVEDLKMSVEVEQIPKKKITKLYGYEYPKQD